MVVSPVAVAVTFVGTDGAVVSAGVVTFAAVDCAD